MNDRRTHPGEGKEKVGIDLATRKVRQRRSGGGQGLLPGEGGLTRPRAGPQELRRSVLKTLLLDQKEDYAGEGKIDGRLGRS